MAAARWDRIQTLFHHAAELPAPERQAFLAGACGEDAPLLADVLAMLEEDARGESLLDRDVAHVAHQVLGASAGAGALPLEQFGRYRITGVLGEGGMGVVYLAERTDVGGRVAIKILRDAWLSPARRERFAGEQRMLAQLTHPSIAVLYDAGTLRDGTPWFVMEYVEGEPLTRFCERRASGVAERLRLFRAVCEAVQHAHRHLVIHRDLKPSNILVTADGTIKLLDFGISKQLESHDASADQTRTGLRLMTPAYAAPEQLRGERVGVHTDVYSLGVILFELLTGRLPFDLSNRTPGEAEAMIVGEEAGPPSVIAGASGRAWADLDVLCLTAMQKDPQRRYRTVEALIRDVDHYLLGEPLEARPDTLGYRAGKFARRHARALTAAAVILAGAVSLIGFYTIRLRTARNEAVAEAARTQRIQRFTMNLFAGGDEAAGPSDSLRVVTLLDRGLQEARSLDNEPAVQAELYQTLGGIYQKIGNLARADTLLRASLEQRKRLFGDAHPDVAASLVALGLLRVDQAQFEDAESLVRDGLTRARRALPARHPSVARATSALGQVLEERGQYDSAIVVLEEAVRMQGGAGDSSADLASSLYELANTHFYAGHFAISDSLNQRVLAMVRRIYGDQHPLVSDVLINLGANQFEWGKYPEAERYYREGLAITRAWFGPEHAKTASNLTMLGRALIREDRYDEAMTYLRQSLAIQERVYGKVHPRVASAVNEIGTIALQRKQYDEAEASYRRMADIYRVVYGEKHYLIGIALSNLGSVYVAREQYSRAEPLFRQALALYAETQGAEHLNAGIARLKLGRTLLRARRFAEAEREITTGYAIVMMQTSPSVSWLQAARKDLIILYDSLKQPEKAARYRAEVAEDERRAGTSPK